ncbi:hypothetical protein K030075H31_31270 [Blautia producta]
MRPVIGVFFLRMECSGVMSYYYEYAKRGKMMTKGRWKEPGRLESAGSFYRIIQ